MADKTTWERALENCCYHDPCHGSDSAKVRAMQSIAFALCEFVDAIKKYHEEVKEDEDA